MAIAEKQDSELASKKYGLNWDAEREPEQVVLDCENNLPVLKRVKGKEIREPKNNGQEDNILIEGDNYHALTVLNYTHQEKIDVIYIDPPYNTGAQDWKYNNNYVVAEDGYRHSKWLNMMEKRLNLAKNLLKEDGVICVTIDDYELRTLWMLMDKIFGENNHLGTIVIRNNPAGRSTTKGISITHEYAIFFGKSNISHVFRLERNQLQKDRYDQKDDKGFFEWVNFRKPGSMRIESPSMFYPIFVTTESVRIPKMQWNSIKEEWITLEKPKKGEQILYPVDENGEERRWRYGVERARAEIGEFKPKVQKGKLHAYVRGRLNDDGILPMTWWDKKEYSSTAYGTNLLKEIFSKLQVFSYPKSIFAVIDCLKVMTDKKTALVLDFFAGSGTTGHAVLELNKEDVGNRKFILCTNNEVNGIEKELKEKGLSDKEIQEYGICRKITYPRLEKVIKGYKKNGNGEKVEGLGGNLQYFRTDLIKQTKNKDQVRLDLTEKCAEMLCVKENIFNLETEKEDYKIFSSNKGDKFLCVYYNLFDESFKEFLKEINKLKGEKKVYMFSIDGTTDRKLFAGVKDCVVEEIPQKIIDIYKQIVKMNIPVKANTIFLEFENANKKIFGEKEKDEGARILRIVLEKTIQKISQKNNFNIFKDNRKEEKIATLNERLYESKVFNKVQWEENKTFLAIGNNASHGEYGDYNIKQVENFYRHIQSLLNDFGI